MTFEEWLFYINKPSPFYLYSYSSKIFALFIVAGFFMLASLPVFVIISTPIFFKKKYFNKISSLLLAIIATIIAMLMIDNITVTLFSWGIKNSNSYVSVVYLIILAFFFVEVWKLYYYKVERTHKGGFVSKFWNLLTLISFFCFIFSLCNSENRPLSSATFNFQRKENSIVKPLPNILFFSADGVNAKNLKLYGYQHQTTPYLDQLAKNSLLIENASTNATVTYSSILSILTGRYPATTKTFYPPQILQNESAYMHLPGILRNLGYKNAQIAIENYADAFNANLKNGFDLVNGRYEKSLIGNYSYLKGLFLNTFLIDEIISKTQSRILHLLRIKKMQDNYQEVQISNTYNSLDQKRVNQAINFIENTSEPFFLQVHLLSTHCCKFKFKKKIFKSRYDNSIYYTDLLFAQIIETLKKQNKLQNTVIVYSSDHGSRWGVIKKIPLIFIFPDSNKLVRRENKAQLLDIGPTILDYLNIKIPDWMDGVSLLKSEAADDRSIFSVSKLYNEKITKIKGRRVLLSTGPPNYGLVSYTVKLCSKWYKYNIINKSIESGIIPNIINKCKNTKNQDEKTHALSLIKEHLHSRGIGLEYSN